jgi:hypothetical protein
MQRFCGGFTIARPLVPGAARRKPATGPTDPQSYFVP